LKDSRVIAGKSQRASKSAKSRPKVKAPTGNALRTSEELKELIAVAAYYLAERRNFEPGHDLEDWLSAEAQVLSEAQGLEETSPPGGSAPVMRRMTT
jgi:hypothetical protein